MADFKALIALIDNAVTTFNKQIPGIQKKMLEELQLLTQKLDVKDGKIKVAAANLKVLSQIRGKLDNIMLNPEYVSSVKQYAGTFNQVVKLQHDYFSDVEGSFKPPKLGAEIKKQAVESVVHSLTERGLNANIADKIHEMMRKAITGGASYSSMSKQLTDFIVNNESGDGQLVKYTKQISTDALNQFSGQYTQVIASDLGFEWFRYSGSNIETTRPFCLACTDRKYFHISELPEVLKGDFPEFEKFEGKINTKNDLPEGMIPGTDVTNFMTNRGGYNCGHQWRPVSEDLVPEERKTAVYATPEYKAWAAAHGKKVVEPPAPKEEKPAPAPKEEEQPPAGTSTIQEKVVEKNRAAIDELKQLKYDVHEDLFQHLGEEIKIEVDPTQKNRAYYHPTEKKIVVGDLGDRLKSEFFRKTVVAHETAHAIHNTKGIIHKGTVSKEYATHFKSLQKTLGGKGREMEEKWWELQKGADNDAMEQLMVIYDILGSLTGGRYGGGHDISYYRMAGKSESEIFAHSVALLKAENKFTDMTPEMKEITEAMKAWVSKVL